jgi:hypothetical protein
MRTKYLVLLPTSLLALHCTQVVEEGTLAQSDQAAAPQELAATQPASPKADEALYQESRRLMLERARDRHTQLVASLELDAPGAAAVLAALEDEQQAKVEIMDYQRATGRGRSVVALTEDARTNASLAAVVARANPHTTRAKIRDAIGTENFTRYLSLRKTAPLHKFPLTADVAEAAHVAASRSN